MSVPEKAVPIEQGHGGERLLLPSPEEMTEDQRAAAQALISGPRKGIYGPFAPLLRQPLLIEPVARLGEALRFGGRLPADVRELVICLVARHVGNQFEWVMHAPLARSAGIPATVLEAIRTKRTLEGLSDVQRTASDFCKELLTQHEIADPTYRAAASALGDDGVVELSTLIGYFSMVSWIMNVGRTASRPTAEVKPLA